MVSKPNMVLKIRRELSRDDSILFLTRPTSLSVRAENLNLNTSVLLLREITNCNDFDTSICSEAGVLLANMNVVDDIDTKRTKVFDFLNKVSQIEVDTEANRTLSVELETTGVKHSIDGATINIELKNSRTLQVNIGDDLDGFIGFVKIAQNPSLNWTQGSLEALARTNGYREYFKSLVRTTIPEEQYSLYLELCYANFKTSSKNLVDLIKQIVNDPKYQGSIDTISDEGLDKVAEFSKRYEDFSSTMINYLNGCRSRDRRFSSSDLAKQIQAFIDKGSRSINPVTKAFFIKLRDGAVESPPNSLIMEARKLLSEAGIIIRNDDHLVIGEDTISLTRINPYMKTMDTINRIRPFFPLIKAAQQASWEDDALEELASQSILLGGVEELTLNLMKKALLTSLSEDQDLKYLEYYYNKTAENTSVERRLSILTELLGDDSEKLKQYKNDPNFQVYLEADLQKLVNFSRNHEGFFDYLLRNLKIRKGTSKASWWKSSNRYRVLAIIASAKQYASTAEFARNLEARSQDANLLYIV